MYTNRHISFSKRMSDFGFNQYVPYVGDSKRAMDEYTSEIFMGGNNTIVLHNTCEDSLLAAPIILDLVLLAELSTRIQLKAEGEVCFFLSDC